VFSPCFDPVKRVGDSSIRLGRPLQSAVLTAPGDGRNHLSKPESTAAFWKRTLAPYTRPSRFRSALQIANTFLPFAGMWALMYVSVARGWPYWITLLLALPTAGLLVRLFIIQHDCGHRSFLKSRGACDLIGSVIGVLTLTPYHYWRQEHAQHHAKSGQLDGRGAGDIDTLTVAEYEALSPGRRFLYRLYRNPLVLFVIGPPFHFIVKQRFPWNALPRTRAGWVSIWFTNAALVAILVAIAFTSGLRNFLLVQIPITLISCCAGVWLFYVQHQFEETYWRWKPDWNYHDAALHGCSNYAVGQPLMWLTGNIGLHHIHHMSSRVPNYRLPAAQRAIPELQTATTITLVQSLRCMYLTLWDESRNRLVSFRELGRMRRAS
jgi:omega-6 fatty acid desaturase (delta-12 desaturase)